MTVNETGNHCDVSGFTRNGHCKLTMRKMQGSAVQYLFHGRLHLIDNERLLASRGNEIFLSTDCGKNWETLVRLPLKKSQWFLGLSELGRRLLRSGVHHIITLDRDKYVIIAFGNIYFYDHLERLLQPKSLVTCGSKPLTICQDDSGQLYWGEYWSNAERRPVYIHASVDGGASWQRIFKYEGIRHIHGVYYDPFSKAIWITTGDTNEESGIWVTGNGFRTVERVIGGSQQTRSVQLLFTKQYVYFGSDAPQETNFLYRLEKVSGRVEVLQEMESPVFWGCKVDNHLFFSTVVEPTSISPNKFAYIWGSKDGERWKRIAGFRKDIWPMRLFQYGQIQFPTGENDTGYLFFTSVATEKHGTIQRLKVTDIFGD